MIYFTKPHTNKAINIFPYKNITLDQMSNCESKNIQNIKISRQTSDKILVNSLQETRNKHFLTLTKNINCSI